MKTRVQSIRIALVALAALATLGAAAAAADRFFGESLDAELAATPIAEILAEPEAWEGRRVRIEGRVSGVCTLKGCWLELAAADDSRLRIKVDDGVIVFPPDAVGHEAAAEGEVEVVELDRRRWKAWLRHQAEERGEDFDPASVGDGPYRIVRLRGAGAVVGGP